jgi:hypothetical protein
LGGHPPPPPPPVQSVGRAPLDQDLLAKAKGSPEFEA